MSVTTEPTELDMSANLKRIAVELDSARRPEECIALAEAAEQLANPDLQRRCLERAIALDRNCHTALLMLAALSMDDGSPSATFALLEETSRFGLLPDAVAPLHAELFAQTAQSPEIEHYLRAIGRTRPPRSGRALSVVLVTNLFPPQELGGYGRMMWEFAQGLVARGHTVRVLTSNSAQFSKQPTPDEVEMEAHVNRTLELTGTWVGGRPVQVTDGREIRRRLRDNAARIRTAVTKLDADLVLVGNLDFLGVSVLRPALERTIPVLHALANANPGYAVVEQPTEEHYMVAPCSDWNGEVFKTAGFTPSRTETLYPGGRVDRFFRLFLPDVRRLRLCYASLVLPYKGAQTLVSALTALHTAGIDFSAEIAGDAPDADFLAQLRETVRAAGMEAKVQFTGFLDRQGLASLFARSNVLVFPSIFQEPFGISQIEALAAGLVVVSSGTGGAREVIRDGVDGLLFTAGDVDDLAAKLRKLAEQPELMSRLQRASQPRAITFSVEAAVQKIETLAEEMHAAIAAREESVSVDL